MTFETSLNSRWKTLNIQKLLRLSFKPQCRGAFVAHSIVYAVVGYFYHIATMADVHDYVQDYVRVMARPLVVHDVPYSTWTGVHVNTPVCFLEDCFQILLGQ